MIPDLSEELEAWKREVGQLFHDDPGQTAKEIADGLGVARRTLYREIVRGVKEGRYIAGKARRLNARGYLVCVPVYQIVEKETPCDQS